MVLTPSSMVSLGTKAYPFNLKDSVTQTKKSLNELKSNIATVIMFICNHCPYVKHIQTELVKLANDYIPKGISFIAICSNDEIAYPEDNLENMKKAALEVGYPFPYFHDETQEIAKSYQATCTPDFFIYDRNLKLAYRGQLDDSRPENSIPLSGKDIRQALDALLENKTLSAAQKPSVGCNIKWKK